MHTKGADGKYHIHGKTFELLEGSRAQVWHGTAYKTSGGLKKDHILMNKSGRIVSKSKHNTAKKDKRLIKAGYGTKKGKFGFVLLGKSKSKKSRKGMRGGEALGPSDYPSAYSNSGASTGVNPQYNGIAGQGITAYSGPSLQLQAGQAGGRHKKSRRHRKGGSLHSGAYPHVYGSAGSGSLPAGSGIAGQGITAYSPGSVGVQFAAGQAGGKRRRKSRR